MTVIIRSGDIPPCGPGYALVHANLQLFSLVLGDHSNRHDLHT